ncbi:MAG: hypothetical protein K8R54_15805 [Bacteroidales bacterium]|nr:hypothetical protein [Bacteroidales bacterium]
MDFEYKYYTGLIIFTIIIAIVCIVYTVNAVKEIREKEYSPLGFEIFRIIVFSIIMVFSIYLIFHTSSDAEVNASKDNPWEMPP